jgi:hypothetical protein
MAVNYRGKKFYNIGPRGQCYKTFYCGNLPPFHGNTAFYIIKLYYPGNYSGVAVNYHGILTLEKVG